MRRAGLCGGPSRGTSPSHSFTLGRVAAPLVLLLALATCPAILTNAMAAEAGSPGGSGSPAAVLVQADIDFDKAVAEKGVEAWVSFFAEDGIMFRAGEVVQGRAAIRELMAPTFATPGFSLRWKPVRAEIAASSDLGYTYGTYESTSPGSDGKPATRTGMYVTIWRKQSDGSWRVAVDLGSPAPPPAKPPN
jgi:uncharacterized protein (TIGR02246 family)